MSKEHQGVVIYDGACPFCKARMEWLQEADRENSFEFIPWQSEERKERFPSLQGESLEEGVRLVLPDGNIVVGADAAWEILRRLPRWRWVAFLYRVPGFHRLGQWFYEWVAEHRYYLGEKEKELKETNKKSS